MKKLTLIVLVVAAVASTVLAQQVMHSGDRTLTADTTSRAYLGARNLPASGVAVDGYSPVSYFTAGRAEPGSPDYAVDFDGVTYWLTSAEQVALFRADPKRYVPTYGGWCAFGMSVEDKFPVDPRLFKIVDGRLLLFLGNAGVDAHQLWNEGNEADLTRKADAHWKAVSG